MMFYVFGIIFAAIVIGYLYWDKLRECKQLENMIIQQEEDGEYHFAMGVFVRQSELDGESVADAIVKELSTKWKCTIDRRAHKWGQELTAPNGYRIYVCDPDVAIPNIKISQLFIGDNLSVDQVLQIMSKFSGQIAEVHLYETKEIKCGDK